MSLTDGTYQYRVRAYNVQGTFKAYSSYRTSRNSIVAKTPSVPNSISTNLGSSFTGSIDVSWGASSGIVDGYQLYQQKDGGNWTLIYTGTTLLKKLTLPDGSYLFKVRAYNSESTFIAYSSYISLASNVKMRLKPTTPSVDAPSSNSGDPFVLSWSTDTKADYYIVNRRLSGGTWSSLNSSLLANSLSVTESASGTYEYQVKACNDLSCSDFSVADSVTVLIIVESNESEGDLSKTLADINDAPSFMASTKPISDTVAVIPSKVSVQGGRASYLIPIQLPPGRHGMQPSVSLSYTSGNGNGLLGQGWSLSAGGSIHRCAGIWGLDNDNARDVVYASTDKLCINGYRLMLSSGSYGEGGAIYYPEMDLTTKVIQTRNIQDTSSYFTVYRANGHIEYFGENDNSVDRDRSDSNTTSVVRSWHISKRVDNYSNNVMYNYSQAENGPLYLEDILYTGKNNQTGNRKVEFSYVQREDISAGYIAGKVVIRGKRLGSIKTSLNNTEIASYDLDYLSINGDPTELTALTSEGTRKSFLDKITLTHSGQSAKVTKINWSPLSGLLTDVNAQTTVTLPSGLVRFVNHADYDGDGILDHYAISHPSTMHRAEVYLSSTESWIDVKDIFMIGSDYDFLYGLVSDFNGDGRAEIIGYRRTARADVNLQSRTFMSYANWNGSSFDVVDTNIGIHCVLDDLTSFGDHKPYACASHVADLNGDGLDDFIATKSSFHDYPSMTYFLRDVSCDDITIGDDCAFGFRKSTTLKVTSPTGYVFVDLNGDGRKERTGRGDSNFKELNADGLLDRLTQTQQVINIGGGERVWIEHNIVIPGTIFDTDPYLKYDGTDEYVEFTIRPFKYVKSLDIDNDGLEDLLVPSSIAFSAEDNPTTPVTHFCNFSRGCGKNERLIGDIWLWHVWVARINALSGLTEYHQLTSGPVIYGSLIELEILDINGDGHRDIFSNIRPNYAHLDAPRKGVYVYYNQSDTSDLLVNISDGLITHEFEYTNLSEGNPVYLVDYNQPQPASYVYFKNGYNVVKSYITNDGVGGSLQMNYRYENALFHTAGRGFQGFKAISVEDVNKGLVTRSEFAQNFPFTGSLLSTEVRQSNNNNLLSGVVFTPSVKLRDGANGEVSEHVFSDGSLSTSQLQNSLKYLYTETVKNESHHRDGFHPCLRISLESRLVFF